MFAGDITIVKAAELKAPNKGGEVFAVARAVYKRQEYRRAVGSNVTVPTFMGLVAFGAARDALMELATGEVVRVTGELREDPFITKSGQEATDLKLVIATLSRPAPVTEAAAAAAAEDADYAEMLASTVKE